MIDDDLTENQYTFTGRQLDPESGLYHFHFRQYDPTSGVWTTPDPIGISGGMNVYTYAGNNPVNWRDWLGLAMSAGELGVGNPGSYGGENTPDSMYGSNGLGTGNDWGVGEDGREWDDIPNYKGGLYCEVAPDLSGLGHNIYDAASGRIRGSATDPQQAEELINLVLGTINPQAKAQKLLKEFERLAEKLGLNLSKSKIDKLNRLRDSGEIKHSDLPAKIQRDFPAELKGKSLSEIKKGCK